MLHEGIVGGNVQEFHDILGPTIGCSLHSRDKGESEEFMTVSCEVC